MTLQGKGILKNRLSYLWSKIAPKNSSVNITLKNGLTFIVRARTMDKSVLKEVWIKKIYDRFGIRVEKGDTVIDIGAHIGVFSVYAAHLSEYGKVYAFEPFIENFKKLEEHKILNKKENLFVFNLGVAAKEELQTLYLSPDNNTGGHSLHLKSESDRKVEIRTIRLMDFCEKEKIERIDFLKLDCEGAEFEILQSDASILNRVSKIIMECHPFKDNTTESMIQLLQRYGFDVQSDLNSDGTGVGMLYAKRL